MADDYELLPRATKDVRVAFRYYAARSPLAARRFLTSFDETVERIRRFPHSFGRLDPIHRFAKIKKYPYLILFRIRPGFVLIVGVGHSKRSDRFWARRMK